VGLVHVCIWQPRNNKTVATDLSFDSRMIYHSSQGLALIVVPLLQYEEETSYMNSYLHVSYASGKLREGPDHIELGTM